MPKKKAKINMSEDVKKLCPICNNALNPIIARSSTNPALKVRVAYLCKNCKKTYNTELKDLIIKFNRVIA